MAPVLHEFHMRHPNVLFTVTMSSTDETVEALINGMAEIGLVVNPPERDTIAVTEIFRDTIVAAVAPTHALARRNVISLPELADFPLILTETSFGLRQQIDRILAHHSVGPNIFCVTNSLALSKGIACFDRECTLLPRFAVQQEVAAGTLCAIPVTEFNDYPLVFCFCALRGRSMTPAAKAFVDDVIEFCRRYS